MGKDLQPAQDKGAPASALSCGQCGREYEIVTEPRTLRFRGGREATVLATVRRCPGCGEVFWSPEEAERARLAAAEEIRTREGLLLASEIRELRRSIGLTQPDFERLLGVGPKTAARWEAGTVFQSGAADHLMRVVREVPGAAEHLAARNGVRLRPVRHEPRRRSA